MSKYSAERAVLDDMNDTGYDADDNMGDWADNQGEEFGRIGLTDFDPDVPQDRDADDETDEWLRRRAA